jgi:hypothetical protein
MPGFADGGKNYPVTTMMTLEEAKAIHAYLIDAQWKAYEADQKERANAPKEKVSQQRTN